MLHTAGRRESPQCVLAARFPLHAGYSLGAILRDGLTATEASELRAGRISPSLATKLELSGTQKKVHYCTLQQVNAELAEVAAIFKACPAVVDQKSGK